jgi:hypothetical protein
MANHEVSTATDRMGNEGIWWVVECGAGLMWTGHIAAGGAPIWTWELANVAQFDTRPSALFNFRMTAVESPGSSICARQYRFISLEDDVVA